MSEYITDEAVEKAARALRQQLEDAARAALEAAAPLIAAKAWDEGYAMSERELDHAYGGHPVSQDGDLCHECGTGNPYRTDRIESVLRDESRGEPQS